MSERKALAMYAGPRALEHIAEKGFTAADVRVIPGAAGGPKGLVLGALDRFIFGQWLPTSQQPVDLVGASIGAWRMASVCMGLSPADSVQALLQLEHDYIHQNYPTEDGKRPTAAQISTAFRAGLENFYPPRAIGQLLQHPRYRLHVIASRGRGLLEQEHPWKTPLGYALAFGLNALHRPSMARLLERVVFSAGAGAVRPPVPFDTTDYATYCEGLNAHNFLDVLQASCAIPLALQAVQKIADAPSGAYWDGGITDYHLHLNYAASDGVVLYPHFQKNVVPGWLDKSLKWRHGFTQALDHTLIIAPQPRWVKKHLPNGKLPDRSDFMRYAKDFDGRVRVWTQAAAQCLQLADEFAQWLEKPDPDAIKPLSDF